MRFEEFIKIFSDLPVIDTEILAAGKQDGLKDKVQISRWEKSGKLLKLRRGLYLLGDPYRKAPIWEFYIAGVLHTPSYISMEAALEHHGLIPEAVKIFSSVTTKRPCAFATPVGHFNYRHVQPSLFWGYNALKLDNQTAFVATPEKALLDLIYLNHIQVSESYLRELRLQNLGSFDLKRLKDSVKKFNKPRITLAGQMIQQYFQTELKMDK